MTIKNIIKKNKRLTITIIIVILFMGITIGYSNLSSNLMSSLSGTFKGLMDYNVYAILFYNSLLYHFSVYLQLNDILF